VATARTYLDALVSHQAAHVRLAPDVVRYENGVESMRGAAAMRRNLETFPLYKAIASLHDVSWIVDGNNAVAFYLLDVNAVPGVSLHAATAHVSEWFHVQRGLITRIDVVECFALGFRPESVNGTTHAGLLTDLCARSGARDV
jgi:hypothetical protein